jgi:hypothetical protein
MAAEAAFLFLPLTAMIYQWQLRAKTRSDTIVAHLFDSTSLRERRAASEPIPFLMPGTTMIYSKLLFLLL